MLDSIDTHHGLPHVVDRSSLYQDCITLYSTKFGSLIKEFPFRITYKDEEAIDTGGVARDMFSAFWEEAYLRDLDGGSTFVPIVHPHAILAHYTVLGSILTHGFMVCGFLPVRLSFPTLAYTLLGSDITISSTIVTESFIDFISTYKSSVFQRALKWKGPKFTNELQENLVEILGRMGCRKIPTADNIHQLVIEVARYELCIKPLGAVQALRAGVPTEFYPFWNAFSVKQLHDLYKALCITPKAIIDSLQSSDDLNANQMRIFSYLKTFIGNLTEQDLMNFSKFVTGSSVMLDKKMTITFNNLSGLARRPISHTCGCTLQLSTTFLTYPEFAEELLNVLRSDVTWPMEGL